MGEQVKLHFRPSLIIFVGEAGRHIREQFGARGLLANLDKPLRQSVALLQVTVDGNETDLVDGEVQLYAEPFPIAEAAEVDDDMPTKKGLLQDVIYRALLSVQLDRRRLAIMKAGYAMPDPRTQIQIVGAANDDDARWLARILLIVREQVNRNHFNTTVSYFLNVYNPITRDFSPTLKKSFDSPELKWDDYELPNFSYLYQHIATYPTTVFANIHETQYATAEALLALTSTGVTLSTLFENEMRQNVYLEDYSFNVGTLSTSMIMFPRTAASSFCSARLSYDLMGKWHEDLNRSVMSESVRKKMQNDARNAVTDVEKWMGEHEERFFAPDSNSPSLRILIQPNHPQEERVRHRQSELHSTLEGRTKQLFNHLTFGSVMHEFRERRNKKEEWVDIADKRGGQAVERYRRWDEAARNAWDAATLRIGDEVKRTVDELWPSTENGFELARIYVDEYFNSLQRLAEHVTKLKTEHQTFYEEDQERFAKLTEEGVGQDSSNIQGDDVQPAGRARPTMGYQGSDSSAKSDISFSGGQGGDTSSAGIPVAQASAIPGHLPEREDRVVRKLKQRANWKQRQVPAVAALGANGFVLWLTTTFLVTGIATPLHIEPLILFAINSGFLLLVLVSSALYALQRYQEVQVAREELLTFYRRWYVSNCEKREDLQRYKIMRTLQGRVGNMRRRLNAMSDFLLMMQEHAQQESVAVQNQLFNSPAGSRDIFVVNGERLQKEGLHTLESLFEQVTQLRINQHKRDWHRTLDEMKNKLIEEFRSIPESFVEASEDVVQQKLDRFTASVVDAYLTGTLVDISTALNKQNIWDDVLELVGKPYYHTTIGIRDPQLRFVCGSQQDLNKSSAFLPTDTITVQTKNPEWLLLGAFFRGGGPDALDASKLFPIKSIKSDLSDDYSAEAYNTVDADKESPHVAQNGNNTNNVNNSSAMEDDQANGTGTSKAPSNKPALLPTAKGKNAGESIPEPLKPADNKDQAGNNDIPQSNGDGTARGKSSLLSYDARIERTMRIGTFEDEDE